MIRPAVRHTGALRDVPVPRVLEPGTLKAILGCVADEQAVQRLPSGLVQPV